MKRIIKNLMLVVMMVASVLSASTSALAATSNYETQEDVSYQASNAVGGIVANAISESDSKTEYNDGYGVFGIVFNGDTVDVSLSAPDYSTAVVAVYEEETMKMVTSGKEYVNSDDESVSVTLAEYDLPDYFIIKVFILDHKNAPVCESYVNKEYTKDFEAFFAKTVFDFDEEQVINLGGGFETNFAVVSDNAVIIKFSENVNTVVTDDYENGIYIFENADSQIKSLKKGETFYYVYGDGAEDYILAKVGRIATDGAYTTITADSDCEISDLFTYVDINTSKQDAPATFAYDEESGKENIGVKTFDIADYAKSIDIEDENCSIKANFGGEMKCFLSFYYDFNIGPDEYAFSYWFQVKAEANIELMAEGEYNTDKEKKVKILSAGITVLPGLDINVELTLTFTVEAKLTAVGKVSFSLKNGAEKTNSYYREICNTPDVRLELDISGEYDIHVIPELTTGFEVLEVIHADLVVSADFSTSGTLYVATGAEDRAQHPCALCVEGSIDVNVNVKIIVKFGPKKSEAKTIVDIKPFDRSYHLGDYYISITSGGLNFGWENCPNKVVHTQDCGTFLNATLLNGGELIISGVGNMHEDYAYNILDSHIELPWWHASSISDKVVMVTIENGVTNICDGAFMSLDNLIEVSIPASVTSIGKFAFSSCDSLTTVYYGGTQAQWNQIKKGSFSGLNKVDIICTDTLSQYSLMSLSLEEESTEEAIDNEGSSLSLVNATDETVTSAIVGNSYVMMIVKDKTKSDLLSSDNLLYIDQKTAESETFTFDFVLDESVAEYETVYTNAYLYTHNYKAVVTPATCTEGGYITYTCSCGASYVDNCIDALGHSYSSEITTPATHLKEGIKTYSCECGDNYTESVDKTPEHFYNSVVTSPACTVNGYTTYTCECGDSYKQIIPSTGHSYGDDNICDSCGDTKSCDHLCHKSGFMGFIWKLLNFFRKLFKTNPTCECGAAHY